MPGPWEKYQKKGSGPWEKYRSVEVPAAPARTMLESAGAGALQGASFGLADEVEGGLKAARDVMGDQYRYTDLLDRYRANRDTSRAAYEKARQDNPASYATGEIGGGVATAFVPGLGWMNAAKGAKAATVAGKAALGGSISGFGLSDADITKGDIAQSAEDTAVGAGAGLLGQGIVSGASKAIKAIPSLPKKMASVFLNTPEEITETYIKNPVGVRTAPKRFELAGEYEGVLDRLKGEVKEGSQASRDILSSEGAKIKGSEISGLLGKRADEIAARSEGVMDDPETLAAYKWLRENQGKYSPKSEGPPSPLLDAAGNPIPSAPMDLELSTNRIKDTLQGIDRSTDFETAPGKFSRINDVIKKGARSDIDDLLKSRSPAYAQQMEGVAKDTQLLSEASDVAKSPQGLANLFRRIETDQYGAGQVPRETIEALDKRMGSNILERAKLSNAREAFDKSATNGSRNVNLFSNVLKKLPWGIGDVAGPIAGATVDKFGRNMTMGAVDTAVKLNQIFQRGDVQSYVQAAKPLIEAAKQGNPGAILTFQMLSQSNPEALRYLEQQGDGQ